MQRDIRNSAVFQEAERILEAVHRPGEEFISDVADLQPSRDASRLLFTGTSIDALDAPRATRICEFDVATEAITVLTSGPNSDRHARTSPDGKTVAFLSDRGKTSDFQLFFLDPRTGAVTAGPAVEGWTEYFEWSRDGRHILLGVAGHGADLSSGEGAYKTDEAHHGEPDWMPHVIGASAESLRRTAWIFDLDTGALSRASSASENIWEATWCGQERLAVVTSSDPAEGSWYGAGLSIIDCSTGAARRIHQPIHQIASPRASPSGNRLAFIEAVSSDRGYVAGTLCLYDLRDGTCRSVDTNAVDATYVEWRSDDSLLVAGQRGLETVVLGVDVKGGASRELWKSAAVTTSGNHAAVLGLDRPDDFAFVCESFARRPGIATVRDGSFRVCGATGASPGWSDDWGDAEAVGWQAPDGLRIEGWLLRPRSEPPYPTILHVHGGPVLHWRPCWLGRDAAALMLLRRGYAIFLPNPRGSSGRGQDFAARVIGDVGGADTADHLSGIDHLVSSGIADPLRLGVTGLSYGGYMTCWLTTQDTRFGAAISVGPATNHVSHHLTGNIPQFVSLFLRDDYTNLAGAYYSRSPILHAHRSRTPTLLVCGDLDRCTPAEEALQFHTALLENGVESIVLRYPQEGHGVHGIPAAIDFAARCVLWFERHIPSRAQ